MIGRGTTMITKKGFTVVCIIAFFHTAFPQHSPLWLNEFMASNVLAYGNSNGDYVDWIEIYNSSSATVDLAGLSLTDNPGTGTNWLIPSGHAAETRVPAKGHLILYADGSTSLGANHLGFKLSADSGVIVLIGSDGTTVLDSVSYGRQFRDISYGRYPDGTGQWMYTPGSTPATSNQQGFTTFVDAPVINPDGGFYTSVSVSLSPAAIGDTIRYTLDGTDPAQGSTRYLSPIGITGNSIVKARSFRSGSMPSQITGKAFFLTPHTIPVLALMTDPKNLYDTGTGIYIHDSSGRAWERYGELEYFDNGPAAFHIPAGLRIQGNTGPAQYDKRSFRAYFRKGYGSDKLLYPLFPGNSATSFSEIVFRAGYDDAMQTGTDKPYKGTLIRDPLAGRLWRAIGGLSPYDRFAVLYLNNTYNGIYDLKESISDTYIRDHTGYADIDMFRTRWDWYALESVHGDMSKWNELVAFFQSNSFLSDSKITEASRFLDIENYTDLQAFVHATEFKSWAYGTFVFRQKTENAPWEWTIWDTDRTYSETTWNGFTNQYNSTGVYLDTLITKKLLQNQSYKIKFINRIADLLNSTFRSENVNAIIDSLTGYIDAEIPADVAKWGNTAAQWNINVDSVKSFANQRPAILRQQIQSYFGLSGQANVTLTISGGGKLLINSVTIAGTPWTGKYFRGIPVTITAIPDQGYRFARWESASLPAIETITVNPTKDTTVSALFTPVGNANAELITPKRIRQGEYFPVVVRIRTANGDINPIDQTPVNILFGGGHADTAIAIQRGAGTGVVQINSGSSFTVSAQNANVPAVQKLIEISSAPSVSYSGTRPTGDEVWDNTADRLITADVTIPAGCHLTIQKGTRVLLKKYINIHVKGELTVQGTADEPVLITSDNWSEPWGGIDFDNAIANFEYCMVMNGGGDLSKGQPTSNEGWHTGHQHIFFGKNNSAFTFNQCFFLYSPGKVFGMQDGTVTVRNSVSSFVWHGGEFHRVLLRYAKSHIMNLPDDNNATYTEDIDTDGFHIDYVNPLHPEPSTIDSCYFITGKDDAIDHHYSRLKISDCWLENFVHEGVAASGGDTVRIFNTVALNNDQGFEAGWTESGTEAGPFVYVDHCVAVGNNVGLRIGDSYTNPTYNNKMRITNSILYNNKNNIWNYLLSTHAPVDGALEISYSMTNDSDYNSSPYCITGVPLFDSYYYLLPGSPGTHMGQRGTNMGRADSSALSTGSIVINEIMYNAAAGMDSKDWIELYNPQTTDQNLSGWFLKDEDSVHTFFIPPGTIIRAQGYMVICEDSAHFKQVYPDVNTFAGNISFGFGGKDQVRLYTPEGHIVDSILYDNSSPWPADANGSGYSIVLVDPAVDHTLSSNWARSGQFGGSPGRQNLTGGDTAVPDNPLPADFVLEQNYPNPFNPYTVIRFSVPRQSPVELEVFDLLGRYAGTIYSGQLAPGQYSVTWRPENLSSGVYIYRMRAGDFVQVRKIVLLK
jgi:hypothetical protein